jgi:hypothetical protein
MANAEALENSGVNSPGQILVKLLQLLWNSVILESHYSSGCPGSQNQCYLTTEYRQFPESAIVGCLRLE